MCTLMYILAFLFVQQSVISVYFLGPSGLVFKLWGVGMGELNKRSVSFLTPFSTVVVCNYMSYLLNYRVSGPQGAFIAFGCQKECVGGVPSTDKVSSGPSWNYFLCVHMMFFSPSGWCLYSNVPAGGHKQGASEAGEGGGDVSTQQISLITPLLPSPLGDLSSFQKEDKAATAAAEGYNNTVTLHKMHFQIIIFQIWPA